MVVSFEIIMVCLMLDICTTLFIVNIKRRPFRLRDNDDNGRYNDKELHEENQDKCVD